MDTLLLQRSGKTPLDVAMEVKRRDILEVFVILKEAPIQPSTLFNAIDLFPDDE